MPRSIALAVLLAVLLAAGVARASGTAPASCPAGTYWKRSATDVYGQTSYSITAPCFVTFPADFLVTVSVSDPTYPNTYVAMNWEVVDRRLDATAAATTIGGGSGLWVLTDGTGSWVRGLRNQYGSGTPVNHQIQFSFLDMGQGEGSPAHFWSPGLIGTVTYDPYPGADVAPPAGPTPSDPAGTSASGGCASAGAIPALLGLGAVLAAAWPRRRARR